MFEEHKSLFRCGSAWEGMITPPEKMHSVSMARDENMAEYCLYSLS